MEFLKDVMEKAGYTNVRTLLASGNLIFETNERDVESLRLSLEVLFQETFSFDVPTILRTKEQIQRLTAADPFKDVLVTSETRLYVTFLGSKKKETSLELPYESPEKNFRITSSIEDALFSVLYLSNGRGTVDAMSILEKAYGKDITTRNWNTVQKITLLLQ